MEAVTIGDLREELQAVRGESRVKSKEEDIRNRFLQAAAREIFTGHDWLFNRRSVNVSNLTYDEDTGRYEAPADFSLSNDYYVGTKDKATITHKKEDITLDFEAGKIYLSFPSTPSYPLVYYMVAPDLITDSQTTLYFPQPILIAERAYVRLKTAYFPDEDSDKELARNKRALRELFVTSQPKQYFSTRRWG